MLLERGSGNDIADYFRKALTRVLATDEAQGIELKYSHGRSKHGATKYRLVRRIDLYYQQAHEFKAFSDQEAIIYANNYIKAGKWRGKPFLDWYVELPKED